MIPVMANHRAPEQVAPLAGLMVATRADLTRHDWLIKFQFQAGKIIQVLVQLWFSFADVKSFEDW